LSPDQRAKLKQLTESHVPNQHEVFDLHDGSGVFEFKTDKKGNIDSFRVTNKPPVKDHPAPVKQKMHEDTLHVPFSVPQNIQNEFNKPDYSKMPLNEENPVEMNQPAQPKEEEPLDAQPLYDVPFEKPNHNYTNVNNFSPEPKKEEEPDYSNPELDKQKKDNTGGIDAVKQEFNHAMEALTQHYLQLNRLNSSMQNIARQLTQSNNVTEAYNVQKLISAYEAMVSDVFKVSSQYMNIANQKHFNLQAVNPGLENIKAISNTSLQYLNQMINDIQQITKDAKLLHKVTNDPQMNMLWMMGNSSVNLLQRHYENLLQIVNDPTTWQDTSAVGKATNWLGNQWTNLKNRFK
jgi:archaellum component FlaC